MPPWRQAGRLPDVRATGRPIALQLGGDVTMSCLEERMDARRMRCVEIQAPKFEEIFCDT
jgi:hypothetical protein